MKYKRKNMEIVKKICYSKKERGGFFMMPETIMKDIYNKTNTYYNANSEQKKKSRNKIFCFFEGIHYLHEVKREAKKIDFNKYFEKNENVCSGNFVIKETRIRPEVIFEYLLRSEEKNLNVILSNIEKSYPALNEEKIMVSLMYCFKSKSFVKLIHEIASR